MSVADLRYINASELYQWIQKGHTTLLHEPFQVIDVRGSDYVGGHIVGGWHRPYKQMSHHPELLDQLLEDLRNLATSSNEKCVNAIFHCAQSQQRGPSAALKLLRIMNKNDREHIRVWILRGGFNHWQDQYGDNSSVTEDYQPDLWSW
ncbi:phosphatase YCH1 PWA37_000312 [Arxiozyma heterogenica]|uniref:Rhodanese domain-containing protein n=1 Tax=Arxiozyma heterogenica TaxID=278026 RepID=A0AAN7WHQ9_9SACH|nr:hypothetical protein RI543_004099 [Kazachstania heterogenica]